jgi:hypothetical protein
MFMCNIVECFAEAIPRKRGIFPSITIKWSLCNFSFVQKDWCELLHMIIFKFKSTGKTIGVEIQIILKCYIIHILDLIVRADL